MMTTSLATHCAAALTITATAYATATAAATTSTSCCVDSHRMASKLSTSVTLLH